MSKINEVIEACNKKWANFYELKIDMNEMVRVMDCYDNVLYRCEDFEDLEVYLELKQTQKGLCNSRSVYSDIENKQLIPSNFIKD